MNEGENPDKLNGISEKQRKADERQLIESQNDRAGEAFERERDRRADYLGMEQRIRRIAVEEVNRLTRVIVTLIIAYAANAEYGWPALVVVLLGAFFLAWRADRKEQKLPKHKIEEVDDLASDSVTHERIADLEEAGKVWLVVKGKYPEERYVFDHPYWETVNKRVRRYVSMCHSDRIADNRAARDRSLPYRKAMIAKLKGNDKFWKLDKDLDLPNWARIDFGE